MANTTATAVGQQQLYNDFVLKGFVKGLMPLRSFSFDVSPAPAEKGYTVNVVYVASGSAPNAWTEANGYNTLNQTRAAVSVNLSQQYYVGSTLTDIEVANSSLMRLEDVAYNDGQSLAAYVVKDVLSAITASSFREGYTVNSSSAWNVDAIVGVRKKASELDWPSQRNIIVNPTVMYRLLLDDDLKYIYRGATDVVQQGTITGLFGFQNIYEYNDMPTMKSGSVAGDQGEVYGLAVTPSALAIAMRYLQPQENGGGALVESYPLTDPATGITIGYRKWYDPNYGKMKTVYECVWGKAVGNPNGAISLVSVIDA